METLLTKTSKLLDILKASIHKSETVHWYKVEKLSSCVKDCIHLCGRMETLQKTNLFLNKM